MKRRLEFDGKDSASLCFSLSFGVLFLAMVLYCAIIGMAHTDNSDDIVRAKLRVEEGTATLSDKVTAQKTPLPPTPISYNPKDHPYLATSLSLLALAFISGLWADGLTLRDIKIDESKELKAAKKRIAELEEQVCNYRFRVGDFDESAPPTAIREQV